MTLKLSSSVLIKGKLFLSTLKKLFPRHALIVKNKVVRIKNERITETNVKKWTNMRIAFIE